MPVCDARQLDAAHRPTLRRNGFCMTRSPLAHADLDFLGHDEVVRRYYPGVRRHRARGERRILRRRL